jgi:hypothetical protein
MCTRDDALKKYLLGAVGVRAPFVRIHSSAALCVCVRRPMEVHGQTSAQHAGIRVYMRVW